jgi:glycogen debranching enzyme
MDWFDNINHYNYFSSDGNFLAILWDIADKEKARHIEEAAHIFDLNDVPSQCVHPNYGSAVIGWHAKIAGIKDYHNGMSWLWLGCINALAKSKIGMKKDAIALLKKISDIIVKHGQVYEVYEQNGNPVRRMLYRTEYPFAWSSGLFVHAVSEIIKK